MFPTINYGALRDFSGLDTIRKSCASRSNGIQVDDLPIPAFEALESLKSQLPVSFPLPRVRPTNKDRT